MKGFGRRVLVLTLVLALAAVTAEILLRLAWPQVFPVYEKGMLSPHPVLGHMLTPNFRGSLARTDFRIDVRINEQGLRGAAVPARSPDAVRILCLGDSLTFGWGVAEEQAFPALLGDALQARYAGVDVQTINAGIPFTGTIDQARFLELRIAELDPDIVILQFNAVDDFEQNRLPSRERERFEDGMLRSTPEFTWSTGPAWLTLLNKLKHRSHLVRLASETAGQWLMRANLLSSLETASSDFFTPEEGHKASSLLAEVASLAERAGAATVFLYAPEKMQALARPDRELRAAGLVREAAESAGAGFVDATPAAVAQEDVEALFSKAEGYWTAAGHRMIASLLSREIVGERMLETAIGERSLDEAR